MSCQQSERQQIGRGSNKQVGAESRKKKQKIEWRKQSD